MKKTIQRVLAAVILFAMILSGGFSEVGKVHAEKQQGTTKRAIYVVFDNSGSMYGDGNKAWSQATYAMEVFAAMMNYESGDVMKVFPMHDITTDGNTGSATKSSMEIRGKDDIAQIHNMYTPKPGGTPYTQVNNAAGELTKLLNAGSVDEGWLVVLTDGDFDNDIPASGLKADLEGKAAANENLYVQYLAMAVHTSGPVADEKNPFDFPGETVNDTEIPRESNVPMIRLSHMLCGYPAATVKNFEKGFEYYDEKTLKRVRVRESELTEDEVYQLSRRYRDRLKPIYLDVPVSEEVKKAQDELNEKYEFSDNRPQELIFIATRKHKKDEEHIYESWKTQFEMESSNFSSRNKYPNNCRFICSSITNAENSLYMKELTEFWVSVLTLAINRIPASSLQAYRLYKLGMEASEEELERLLNKRLNRMESVYDFVQERMKMKAELSFEEDDILVPEQKIPVHFDGSSGKELYINTSKIGLSRDCPKDELFTWIMEITEKKRQINQFLKAPRRAIDKASQHLKGRAESFFGDEYKMDQFQVEDLEAEIERLETNVLENSTSGLVDEAKFKEQIETVDKKVKKDIVSHIRRSTAVQVGCCLLLVYLLGFVPYWISAAKLGGSQFGSAVVVALAALAVAAAGGIAALFILRHRVRMSMEEYNHVIHTMVNNVNASADEFGKYFTAVCTYMKAQSIRAGIKLKSESISSAQFILRAHKQALKSSIERDEEVAASYGIRRVAEVEKNITSFFHEEKLPKDNALYYYETDKSDVGIPLNEAGDLVRAPYKFVAKLKLEREDLYDEVKGEV